MVKEFGSMVGQLEVQFALAGITMNTTRFNEALVGMDEEIIELVRHVLDDGSYRRDREQLIKRPSVSETAKLNH